MGADVVSTPKGSAARPDPGSSHDHADICRIVGHHWPAVLREPRVRGGTAADAAAPLWCVHRELAGVALRTDEFKALWQPSAGWTTWTWWSTKARLLPLGVFVCLCFASTWLTTNPIQAARLLGNHPAIDSYTGYDIPQITAAVDAAKRFTAEQGGELNYVGESFNYISLVTHVPSASLLFGFPFSILYSVAQEKVIQKQCQYLVADKQKPKWLVLSLNGVTGFGDDVCGLYQTVNIPGLEHGQLQELK